MVKLTDTQLIALSKAARREFKGGPVTRESYLRASESVYGWGAA